MNRREIEEKRKIEEKVRSLFNRHNQTNAKKMVLPVGRKPVLHEFDLHDSSKVIGGITTSPWKNRTGSYNTGGQDRASTELLWLSLWQGRERRVMILTNKDMSERLFKRWEGCNFPHKLEILHCDLNEQKFALVGTLG